MNFEQTEGRQGRQKSNMWDSEKDEGIKGNGYEEVYTGHCAYHFYSSDFH